MSAVKAWQVDHVAFEPIGPNDSPKSMMTLEIEQYPIGVEGVPVWFAFKVGEHVTILSEESAAEMMEWLYRRVPSRLEPPATQSTLFTFGGES